MPAAAKRFRIAFSFAGEVRDFVEKTAAILAKKFGQDAILYDKYHEAEFARHDLGLYLPKLYGEQSELIVPVLCPQYDTKRWTGWEWIHIYSLLTKEDGHRVMPCRFEDATADGLTAACKFLELDDKTPEETAALILHRLELNGTTAKKKSGGRTARKATAVKSTPTNSRQTIPNNLPVLPHFYGREAELKIILGALSPKARTWGALIDGPGGMGKTSLAVRAAELVPAKDFDRILFLTAKNREMTPDGERRLHDFVVTGYLAMLSEMGRLLKVPGIAEKAEDERAALIQEALSSARALIILDNLESLAPENRDRLYSFLTNLPTTCKAIVTSRRRTDIDARIVRLEKLDRDAAMSFLAELALDRPLLQLAAPEERESLYTETGGNPLIIRWLAGQLGRGKCKTVASALSFLRSAPPNNDPLEFIFGDLLETFTEEETKALSALTFYTRPVEVKHIAEIASLTPPACRTALEDLTGRSLVIADAAEEMYVLTLLVADFLRRVRPEVIGETGNRLENWAYALITENGGEVHDRYPVLDAAWTLVEPAIPLFVAGENVRLQKVCDSLKKFLNFTGRWDERLSLSGQAEAKAVIAGDYGSAGRRAYDAGWLHSFRRQAGETLACAGRAETHWQAAKAGARERAIAIRLRGLGHRLNGDCSVAISAYQESLTLLRSLSAESVDVAIGFNALGDAWQQSGDYRGAERDYGEALRVARAVNYSEGVATYTGNLASLALCREDWLGAETLAREALPLSERVGRLELIARDCYRLAEALLRQGKEIDTTAALPYARRAVEIYTRLGSPDASSPQAILAECEAALREAGGGDLQAPAKVPCLP